MFEYPCNWRAGFIPDPIKKQRIGYITALNGFGLTATLPTDLTVYSAFNAAAPPTYTGLTYTAASEASPLPTVQVVGVMEHFSWSGGVGDPISVSFYVSQENAAQIKALQQLTLKTTSISSLGWWLADFDEETKVWFEQAYPKTPVTVTGQINAPGKNDVRLHVATEPEKVAPNVDVNVYNVHIEIVPAANQQCVLAFANSATKNVVKGWGLVVGGLAKTAVAPTT